MVDVRGAVDSVVIGPLCREMRLLDVLFRRGLEPAKGLAEGIETETERVAWRDGGTFIDSTCRMLRKLLRFLRPPISRGETAD